MNKKSNSLDTKLHYRMYKSGKQWIYQTIAVGVLALAGGVAIYSQPVISHADTVQTTNQAHNEIKDLTSFYNANINVNQMSPFISFDSEKTLNNAVADYFHVDQSKIKIISNYDTSKYLQNTGTNYGGNADKSMSFKGVIQSSTLQPMQSYDEPDPQEYVSGFAVRLQMNDNNYTWYYFPSVFVTKLLKDTSQYRQGIYSNMFSGENSFFYTEFKPQQSISYDPLNIDNTTNNLLQNPLVNEYNKGIKLTNGKQIDNIGQYYQATATIDTEGTLYISNQGFMNGGDGQPMVYMQNGQPIKKIIVSPNATYNLTSGNLFESLPNVTEINGLGTMGTDKFNHNVSEDDPDYESHSFMNMFSSDPQLQSLDLSQVDTTNMSTTQMFSGDMSLTTLKLGDKTILNSDSSLLDQYWVNKDTNEHLFSSQLMDGKPHPGTWVKDPDVSAFGNFSKGQSVWYIKGHTLHVWNKQPLDKVYNTGEGTGWSYPNTLDSAIGDIATQYPQITKISIDSPVSGVGTSSPSALFATPTIQIDDLSVAQNNVEEIELNGNVSSTNEVNPNTQYGKIVPTTDTSADFQNLYNLKSADLSWAYWPAGYKDPGNSSSTLYNTFLNTKSLQQFTLPKNTSGITAGSGTGLAEHKWFNIDRGVEVPTTEDFYKQADQSGTWVNELSPKFKELKINYVKSKLDNKNTDYTSDLQKAIDTQHAEDKQDNVSVTVHAGDTKKSDLSDEINAQQAIVDKAKTSYDNVQNPTHIDKSVQDDVSTGLSNLGKTYSDYKSALLRLIALQDKQVYYAKINAEIDAANAKKLADDNATKAKAEHDAEIAKEKADTLTKEQSEEIKKEQANKNTKQPTSPSEISKHVEKPHKVKKQVHKKKRVKRYIKFKRSHKSFALYQRVLKKHHIKGLDLMFPTMRIINVSANKHGVKFTVQIKSRTISFYVKSRHDIMRAYYNKTDLLGVRSNELKVLHTIQEHKSTKFTGDNIGKTYKRGTILHIKRLVTNHGITRFVLTNGKYVTANKYWVQVPNK